MITRILIRVKVLQNLYSYMLTKPDRTIAQATDELNRSLEKSHELYYYLLHLIVELTDLQDRRMDDAKHKFMPTDEELNPDTRFIDNHLVKALRENEEFNKYCRDKNVAWDDILFTKAMLDRVLSSECYAGYMSLKAVTVKDDCELWCQLLRHVIVDDEAFEEKVESMSVHWSREDVDNMTEFAVKTIHRIQDGRPQALLPMFRSDDDKEFANALFLHTIEQMDESNDLVNSLVRTDRWDLDRVALMDRLIMCTAITEFRCFDSIPTNVTLNEYIELAKLFSTANSGPFVNGVLNAALAQLREQGVVTKP